MADPDLPDPSQGIRAAHGKKRDRVLSERELAVIWHGVAGMADYEKIIRLLVLTGCRREEIAGLQWREINLDTAPFQIELSAARTKQKRPHIIPLSALAIAQLPQPKAHRTIHDIRRSVVTHANELGLAPPHVIESWIGHSVGQSRIAGIYNRASYLAERRAFT